MNSLTWDDEHSRNAQNTYCYCGKGEDEFASFVDCFQICFLSIPYAGLYLSNVAIAFNGFIEVSPNCSAAVRTAHFSHRLRPLFKR